MGGGRIKSRQRTAGSRCARPAAYGFEGMTSEFPNLLKLNQHAEFIKLKKSLKGYGFIDDINETPREITKYLEDKLKKVDSEISLEGNTGYYGGRYEI